MMKKSLLVLAGATVLSLSVASGAYGSSSVTGNSSNNQSTVTSTNTTNNGMTSVTTSTSQGSNGTASNNGSQGTTQGSNGTTSNSGSPGTAQGSNGTASNNGSPGTTGSNQVANGDGTGNKTDSLAERKEYFEAIKDALVRAINESGIGKVSQEVSQKVKEVLDRVNQFLESPTAKNMLNASKGLNELAPMLTQFAPPESLLPQGKERGSGGSGQGFDLEQLMGLFRGLGGGNFLEALGGGGGGNSPFRFRPRPGEEPRQTIDRLRRDLDEERVKNTGAVQDDLQRRSEETVGNTVRQVQEYTKQAEKAIETAKEGTQKAQQLAQQAGGFKPQDELEALSKILEVSSEHLKITAEGFSTTNQLLNAYGQSIVSLLATSNDLQIAMLESQNAVSRAILEQAKANTNEARRIVEQIHEALGNGRRSARVGLVTPSQ